MPIGRMSPELLRAFIRETTARREQLNVMPTMNLDREKQKLVILP